MSLSAQFVAQHISLWEQKLTQPFHPHRSGWPSRLFHHAPIENAVAILKSGYLRSRSDPENKRPKDVAADAVVNARAHAHDYVRFYFRPRTPTQFHIEGIRNVNECQFGPLAHAPVLVMLVFSAQNILSLNGTRFCDRNMQLAAAEIKESEQDFSQIPFDKVFHEGGTGGDRSITEHRCAEVLAASPVKIEGNIVFVYCRSEAERDTLLYMLRDAEFDYSDLIRISDDLRVFQREFVFVEEVSLSHQGIIFRLNPRQASQPIDVQIEAWDDKGKQIVAFRNAALAAMPPDAKKWRVASNLVDGTYRVRIHLEGHFAYENVLALTPDLF